jgi:hypothetical protein
MLFLEVFFAFRWCVQFEMMKLQQPSCNVIIYKGRLKSLWTHITPSRNFVDVR